MSDFWQFYSFRSFKNGFAQCFCRFPCCKKWAEKRNPKDKSPPHPNAIKAEADVIPGMRIEERNSPPDRAAGTNNGELSVLCSKISQTRNGEEESKKSESTDVPSTERLKTGSAVSIYSGSADDVSRGGPSTRSDGTIHAVSAVIENK